MIVMSRRFSDVRIHDTETCPTIETGSGEGGNNLPMIVDTLIFDESQITCPTNGLNPKWGGAVPFTHARSGKDGSDNQRR